MPQRWIERERAIMNGIMSLLVNECDALAGVNRAKKNLDKAASPEQKLFAEAEINKAVAALHAVVVGKIRPTLHACADEQRQLERDNTAIRFEIGNLRTAVETVISNQHVAPVENPVVMAALRAAAPGHAFL